MPSTDSSKDGESNKTVKIKVKGKQIKARKVGPGKDTIYIGFDARLEVVGVELEKEIKKESQPQRSPTGVACML